MRALAPNLVYEPGERELPVDWRECRRVTCSLAPDDPALDAHRPGRGRATAFTHILRRDGRLYVQYWLYYPDSNTTLAGSDRLWEGCWEAPCARYPGFHRDDWEGAFVRVDPDGSTWLSGQLARPLPELQMGLLPRTNGRATRAGCGSRAAATPATCRSAASRAGWRPGSPRRPARALPARPRLIPLWPGHGLRERSTTGEGIRLIPLEALDPRRYTPAGRRCPASLGKNAYLDPEAGES